MDHNPSNWWTDTWSVTVAIVALIVGVVGAWFRDRLGVAHRLSRLETRQEALIEDTREIKSILRDMMKHND